jgi:cell division protein FtsI/penicillin-binding protein 2
MRSQLQDVATQVGFNAKLDFDVPASVGTIDLPYNDLAFARASAGFRNSSISPIGVAHLTYAIALGGQAGRMRLVRQAGEYAAPEGRTLLGEIIDPTTAWRLTRMMEVTVHSGTSLVAFSNPQGSSYLGSIRVAGKTGTLQTRKDGPTTSWFTGFAPSRKPRVVVTVLLQNGKVWRSKANQLARDLLRVRFKDHRGVTDPFETPPDIAREHAAN